MNNIVADSCRNAPAPAQKTYKVDDIARILGIGRSSAYSLVREGHFKVVRIGTSIRVNADLNLQFFAGKKMQGNSGEGM